MISSSLLKRAREAVADRQASLRREALVSGRPNPREPKYRDDPVLYAREILGVTLTPTQEQILRLSMVPPYRVMVKSGHSVGKAQPYDLEIDTPEGRCKFGALAVGDFVFGADGSPVRVVGVFRQGLRPCYRITFDDGSSTLADGEHLWTVRGRQGRRCDGAWETLTTVQIISRGVTRPNGRDRCKQFEVPTCGPVQYPYRPLPVGAYTLGVWLGDGTVGTGTITSADDEMQGWLSEDGGIAVRSRRPKGAASILTVPGLRAGLVALGVGDTRTGSKRVPRQAMENSLDVRLAVLQGLMDTDGTVGASNGSATFCSISLGLTEDVIWLVRSLGGKARMQPTPKRAWYRGKDGERIYGQLAYQATVKLPAFPLFRLERKQRRIPGPSSRRQVRWIASIEPVGECEMRCIRVDAPDCLYLTNDFIVTHNSFIAAVKISHQYDCYEHSATISLAPTKEHVVDVLWTELRLLRAAAPGGYLGGFTGPKAAMLFSGPDHWAKGMTNESGEAFAGRHRENMGFVFDEAVGVDDLFWRVATTMFRPMKGNFFLVIFNPTDPTSRAFLEEQAREGQPPNDRPKWHVVEMSSLDHPNIGAKLAHPEMDDYDLPVPQAVTVEQVIGWIGDMTDRVMEGEEIEATDVEFPPGSGVFYKPGPDFESRALGRWPSGDTYGIWSDALWAVAQRDKGYEPDLRPGRLPVIGCDVAQRGFNFTTIHTRQNNTSLAHERHNGWDSVRTASRLIELCNELAAWLSSLRPAHAAPVSAKSIPVNVDGSGDFGVLAIGQRQGYNFRGVVAQERAVLFDRYDTKRSELWFGTKQRAKEGWLDVSRLRKEDLQRLRSQALAAQWTLLANGCRKVESKDDIRKPDRMGSEFLIDDIDGMNLAYYEPCPQDPTAFAEPTEGLNPSAEKHAAYRRGMYGLKGR